MIQFATKIITSLIIAFALITSLSAAPEDGKTFKDWKVKCDTIPGKDEKICHIQQLITDKENDNPIMVVAVGYLPELTDPTFIVTLPLGVLLPPGLSLQIDENKAIGFPYEVCDQVGCRAGFDIKDDILKQLKAGSQAKLTFANMQRKTITVPISLSGFTGGINSLK